MPPMMVAYTSASWPPGCSVPRCSAVTRSPTWKLMMSSSLCAAPFSSVAAPANLPPVGSSSTCGAARALCQERPDGAAPVLERRTAGGPQRVASRRPHHVRQHYDGRL